MIITPEYTGSGIYALHNLTKDKWYIGSSENVRYRISAHWHQLEKGIHKNLSMQNDYSSGDNFECILLKKLKDEWPRSTKDQYEKLEIEKLFIRKYDSFHNGYNQVEPHAWTDSRPNNWWVSEVGCRSTNELIEYVED